MQNILIGKRITFGAIVGCVIAFAAWLAEENGIIVPAEIAVSLTTAITGIGQIFIANKIGVTQPKGKAQ